MKTYRIFISGLDLILMFGHVLVEKPLRILEIAVLETHIVVAVQCHTKRQRGSHVLSFDCVC